MTTDTSSLIKLEDLNKTVTVGEQQKSILNNINLTIKENDFVAITGASGSGKSTLLSILGLLEPHSGGQYYLCGQAVSSLSRYQQSLLRNQSIGWVFQNFNLIQDMTVSDNVRLPLTYQKNMTKEDVLGRVRNALSAVGMLDKQNDLPPNLSGGQQQRVAIARAIVTEPDLVLADEPTGNLDSENSQNIFNLLIELHKSGRTIVMVTHDSKQAKLCPAQIELADGQIINHYQEVVRNVV